MPADLVDPGHRFEAWTNPNVTTFKRKFDLSRWVGYTVADKYGAISDGRLDLPTDFSKLAQLFKVDKANHANDVSSIIRQLDGTTPINHFVLKGLDDKWSSTSETLQGFLEGMDYFLDKTLVPNFDAPAKPTIEPDWHYGLPSILYNTDFEDAGLTNFRIHLWIESTVTAGTWNIEFAGPTTDDVTLDWNDDITAIQTGIESLSNITDISISGAGTEDNPWVIEVIDPAGTDFNVTIDSSGLTGGAALHLAQSQGGAGVTDPWTRSFNPVTGLFHGTYTNFEISTAQAHTGISSLYVKGALGSWPESYPGAQQVVSATGGRLYRDSVWVYPKFARRYRFVIRTTDETFIAQAEADLTANSWQEIKFPSQIPSHIRSVIFRVSCISNTDGHEFYLDDALFAPGMDAATYGKIMGQLLAACQAAGFLTWVTKTWTDTHDSAGVVWDRNLIWSVRHRQSLLQLVEYADRWNYESDGIHWDITDSRFEWGLYNPSGGGANKQGTGMAVIGKVVSETGTMSKRIPDASHYYAEGDLGYWNEFDDAVLAGAWGPLQKSFFNGQGLDTAGLLELATRLVADAGNRTEGLVTRLQAAPIKPWIDFKPGDRNIMVNLLPKRAREYLRCMAIVATKGRGDATPVYEAHWGSVVYQGEAAVLETVRRLVRKFEADRPATAAFDGRPAPVVSARGGSAPSLVIAPANAPDSSKNRADYILPGAGSDNLTWQEVVNRLAGGGGGRILLTEGDSHAADKVTIVGDLRIEGMGSGSSHIHMAAASNVDMFHIPSPYAGTLELVALNLDGNKANQSSGTPSAIQFDANSGAGALIVDTCDIHDFRGDGLVLDRPASQIFITSTTVRSNGGHGIFIFGEGSFLITNCQILLNTSYGVTADGGSVVMMGTRIHDNGDRGFSCGGVFENSGKVLVGNQITSNGTYGIVLNGLNSLVANNYIAENVDGIISDGPQPTSITGNVFFNNSSQGAILAGTGGGVFSGNAVTYNGQHGVYLNGTYWLVEGNRVDSNSRLTNNTYDGIHLTAAADDCDVLSNTIRQDGSANKHRYSINVSAAGATNNWVAGNRGVGAVTGQYNDAGTGTINVWAGAFGDNY